MSISSNKWGSSLGSSIKNPFKKKESTEESAEKKISTPLKLSPLKLGSFNEKDIKPAPSKINQTIYYYSFGTGSVFESKQDPKAPFIGGLKLSLGSGLKPKPLVQQNSNNNNNNALYTI